MPTYAEMDNVRLAALKEELEREYGEIKARGLALNMARGKPAKAQLDLSMPLLETVTTMEDCVAADGTDCRNYGVGFGLPEAKEFMACMLDDEPDNVIVFGNASLNIMYDTVARCWMFGTLGSEPWGKLDTVKWICPAPGYDRHFGVTEEFGIEMIPVPMTDEGPDMDEVERIAASDPSVKGIWCVPQGCAKRVVTLAKEAGVTMTGAGATYPYKQDPNDSNIRIAPTLPPLEELDEAMDVFTVCVKLAYVEKLLG